MVCQSDEDRKVFVCRTLLSNDMGSFHTKVFFKCLQLKTTFVPTWSNQIYLCSQYSHSKSKVKFSLFVLSKKLSQYCDCVYPVFLTKTCGLSHGISLWDWVLGGTGRKAPISMWFPIAKLPKCPNGNDKETIPKASEKFSTAHIR